MSSLPSSGAELLVLHGNQPDPTCEDGDAMEAAVQLAQEDGEETVSSQAAHVPRALVIDHHVPVLFRLHLGGNHHNRAL